eukprot:198315-Pyramimonas_sp.AAC.1
MFSDAPWDAIANWTEGSYGFDAVSSELRKLRRPSPAGQGGHRIHGVSSSSNFAGHQKMKKGMANRNITMRTFAGFSRNSVCLHCQTPTKKTTS